MAFTIEGLERGIVNCRSNIKNLETAIANERSTIADYRKMIHDTEIAEAEKAEAEANVHLEVVRD
tara:strand:+ start:458 stop:652 length:195 start_codon:yes stop_codon:yes gene_type:complete